MRNGRFSCNPSETMKYCRRITKWRASLATVLLATCLNTMEQARADATSTVPSPQSVLGHNVGDDRYLANYEDSVKYFQRLAQSSPYIKLFSAGKTTQGKEIIYSVISSPRNIANFDKWKALSKRFGEAHDLTDAQARNLVRDAKIIVHIDGGMHSSEVADHQLPIALAYKLLSAPDDPENRAILDDVILVLWPTLNPDGQDMIVDWYRKHVGTPYETSPMPWLYQEFVGHDNNRDAYMLNMIESQVITRTEQTYSPVIWYSQHQTAPFPARIWVPPFSDPISSNISPYMRIWTNAIGTNMMARFEKEGKPGAIAQARFDNWYPGFLDYTHVFRNTISFFTETAHDSATPKVYKLEDFPDNMKDLRALIMYPHPWAGGLWRLRDSVDYMTTASMSVLETAVKYRDTLLYNRYQAARDTINQFRHQAPYAYVVPATQTDTNEARLLMQKLMLQGIEIRQSTGPVTINGKTYPANSWVILMDQPYAGLVKELFESQKYPSAILGGDGKPVDLPYDVTGWTLPMQMGVTVDEITIPVTDATRSTLQKVEDVSYPTGHILGDGSVFAISHKVNASFQVINDTLAQHGHVSFSNGPVATPQGAEKGAIIITDIDRNTLEGILARRHVDASAMTTAPEGTAISAPRVGLYRQWGSNIDEGWTRWVINQYAFNWKSAYNADVRKGNLNASYDTIVIPDLSAARVIPKGQRAGKDFVKAPHPGPLGSLLDGFSIEDEPAPMRAASATTARTRSKNSSPTAAHLWR